MSNIKIVPAVPGHATVYKGQDDEMWLEDDIVAWCYEVTSNDDIVPRAPLTINGPVRSNCIGVRKPDGSVTIFEEKTYLDRIQKHLSL